MIGNLNTYEYVMHRVLTAHRAVTSRCLRTAAAAAAAAAAAREIEIKRMAVLIKGDGYLLMIRVASMNTRRVRTEP